MARPDADPVAGAPGSGDAGAEARILRAARQEFIAKGLGGARVQAIADAAGVTKALVHYYFRSKERLYRTVLQDTLAAVWGTLQAELRALPPGGTLEALLRTLVVTYLRTLASNPDFALFMFREMAAGGSTFQTALKEAAVPFDDIPSRLLEALAAETRAGTARPVDPLHLLVNVMGMSVATFLARPIIEKLAPLLGRPFAFDAAYLEARAESIVDTTLYGIRTRKGGA